MVQPGCGFGLLGAGCCFIPLGEGWSGAERGSPCPGRCPRRGSRGARGPRPAEELSASPGSSVQQRAPCIRQPSRGGNRGLLSAGRTDPRLSLFLPPGSKTQGVVQGVTSGTVLPAPASAAVLTGSGLSEGLMSPG